MERGRRRVRGKEDILLVRAIWWKGMGKMKGEQLKRSAETKGKERQERDVGKGEENENMDTKGDEKDGSE